MANINSSKSSKKAKNKSKNAVNPELLTKIHFTAFDDLKGKTKDKIRKLRGLVVAMLPSVAKEQAFQELQFLNIFSDERRSTPALLVLDANIKSNVTIIKESNVPELTFNEGEEVKISSPCQRLIAEEVSFSTTSHKEIGDFTSFVNYLKHQLVQTNYVIKEENFIIFQYLTQEFILKVECIRNFAQDTIDCDVPSECVWQTRLNLQSPASNETQNTKPIISFDDFGGYRLEINDLKQEIVRLFSELKLAVKAVKGILISGPPGCGKSLIGKIIKSEYAGKCVSIELESTKSKYQGEAEMNLKQQFLKASNRAPCLIFIDDLDLLCTNRDRGDSCTSIITTLLHLIDGVNTANDRIMIVATATKPQSLDAALRRPGRLSKDIFLQSPDEEDRKEIIEKMLTKVPNDICEVDLKFIASNTPGYFGGDLHNVILEAVMHSEDKDLSKHDLEYAIARVKPVALKDAANVDHKITLEDVHGYTRVKSQLLESLNLSLNHNDLFEKCELSVPTQFLIFGPPGCGKSSLVMALAAEFSLSVVRVKRSTVLGKYFGESEQNLARLFAQAQESSPCILHFENFEGLAGRSKGDDGGSDVEGRIINHLKVQLDGIVRNDTVFIFAETNRPDLLDKDVVRPGRFHQYCFMNLPETDDRRMIVENILLTSSLGEDLPVEDIVEQTQGFTVAEIIQLCDEMKEQSTKRNSQGWEKLSHTLLEESLDIVSPNTSSKMLQKQLKFASIYCPTKPSDT